MHAAFGGRVQDKALRLSVPTNSHASPARGARIAPAIATARPRVFSFRATSVARSGLRPTRGGRFAPVSDSALAALRADGRCPRQRQRGYAPARLGALKGRPAAALSANAKHGCASQSKNQRRARPPDPADPRKNPLRSVDTHSIPCYPIIARSEG